MWRIAVNHTYFDLSFSATSSGPPVSVDDHIRCASVCTAQASRSSSMVPSLAWLGAASSTLDLGGTLPLVAGKTGWMAEQLQI